ncbi:MAG: hypothetical protein JRG70_12845 [Deltaproteobacteria bacterium]|nr:hypothetical protein [Deltaproteobacteria bacterium]
MKPSQAVHALVGNAERLAVHRGTLADNAGGERLQVASVRHNEVAVSREAPVVLRPGQAPRCENASELDMDRHHALFGVVALRGLQGLALVLAVNEETPGYGVPVTPPKAGNFARAHAS